MHEARQNKVGATAANAAEPMAERVERRDWPKRETATANTNRGPRIGPRAKCAAGDTASSRRKIKR